VITLAVIGGGLVLLLLAMFAKQWFGHVKNFGLGLLVVAGIALAAITVNWGDDE
jgi:hypothetical membrane protein